MFGGGAGVGDSTLPLRVLSQPWCSVPAGWSTTVSLPPHQKTMRILSTVLEIVTCFLSLIIGFESDYGVLQEANLFSGSGIVGSNILHFLIIQNFRGWINASFWGNWGTRGATCSNVLGRVERTAYRVRWKEGDFGDDLLRTCSTVLGPFVHPFNYSTELNWACTMCLII